MPEHDDRTFVHLTGYDLLAHDTFVYQWYSGGDEGIRPVDALTSAKFTRVYWRGWVLKRRNASK